MSEIALITVRVVVMSCKVTVIVVVSIAEVVMEEREKKRALNNCNFRDNK